MTGCIVVKFMKLETARAWALKDLFEHFMGSDRRKDSSEKHQMIKKDS